jgi:hypothetical protein
MDTGELCQYKIVMVNNMDIIRREVYPEILVEALIKLSASPKTWARSPSALRS